MSDIILKAENISKQYRLGLVGTGSLRHDINRFWYKIRGKEDPYLQVGAVNDRSAEATEQYVWALRDINFEVKQGEILGIIGKNGAGKSTLLKLLSRVTMPTTGTIRSRGTISSLLEVGTGFHPELTGRENIYLNGAILGMTKAEISAKIDEIVAFSGCEMYIDTPVKRYSSGMTVRLGFAVAAHLEPDILVVDEVLAVGDAEFQRKAIGKMQDISNENGRTVLFVSHNMGSIKQLCSRSILLGNGTIEFQGDTMECINQYLLNSDINTKNYYSNLKSNKESDILLIALKRNESRTGLFGFEDKITVELKIRVAKDDLIARIGLKVLDMFERVIFTTNTNISDLGIKKQGEYHLSVVFPKSKLMPDDYKINVGFHIHKRKLISKVENSLNFRIEETGTKFAGYGKDDVGCVMLDCDWSVQ